jgi:hypothetical protein
LVPAAIRPALHGLRRSDGHRRFLDFGLRFLRIFYQTVCHSPINHPINRFRLMPPKVDWQNGFGSKSASSGTKPATQAGSVRKRPARPHAAAAVKAATQRLARRAPPLLVHLRHPQGSPSRSAQRSPTRSPVPSFPSLRSRASSIDNSDRMEQHERNNECVGQHHDRFTRQSQNSSASTRNRSGKSPTMLPTPNSDSASQFHVICTSMNKNSAIIITP